MKDPTLIDLVKAGNGRAVEQYLVKNTAQITPKTMQDALRHAVETGKSALVTTFGRHTSFPRDFIRALPKSNNPSMTNAIFSLRAS
jgi:hypothetical protein